MGDDSENPETLTYYGEHAAPFARRHGLNLEELHRTRRDGSRQTLLERINQDDRTIPIPAFLLSGAPGNRQCTRDFKALVVARWCRERGATVQQPAVLGLGISTDEFGRARTTSRIPYQALEYPLLTLRLSRLDCQRLIAEAGLPIPPKSACWFCPFHRLRDWRRMKHDTPDLFDRAVAVDDLLRDRRRRLGKDAVFLSSKLRPLDEVIAGDQLTLDDALETCDSGYCFV